MAELGPGDVGYLIAGIKDVGEARSGETITDAQHPAAEALAGYRDPKPMVFCGIYPIDGDELPELRDAIDKLKLNDASFTFEPESSKALGFGFRCGFLGLLHMEIVRERLEREFDLSLIATAPSVAYRAFLTDGSEARGRQPDRAARAQPDRPHRRADAGGDHLDPGRVHGNRDGALPGQAGRDGPHGLPLARAPRAGLPDPPGRGGGRLLRPAEEPDQGLRQPGLRADGYATANLVRVDLLINHTPVDAFSTIVHRSQADFYGRRMTEKLRELIPRQLFDVPIQAAIGGRWWPVRR